MQITRVPLTETAEFVERLRYLIRSTIKLPEEAIQYFSNQWTDERVKNCIDSWVFITAKEQDQILGLVLGTPVEGGVGTIIWVLVDSSTQKKGMGSLLFKETCNIYKTKGAHKVKLTVPEEQTVNFYIKQGMHLEGVHKKHWWNADFWAMGIQI